MNRTLPFTRRRWMGATAAADLGLAVPGLRAQAFLLQTPGR